MLAMRHAPLAVGLAAAVLAACLPAGTAGTLAPTLTIEDVAGLEVAMQNGMPVPSFDWQPRPRLDLDGPWRVEQAPLDQALTMAERDSSLAAIEEEAGARLLPDFDDSGWGTVPVPGTVNAPPDGQEGGAWYRHRFEVPADWAGRSVSIRFGSANYVADVWLNGTWLGYHEGGSTPFAFGAGSGLEPGAENLLVVRVHTIPLGTRSDTVPWGLIDWWNYGGLTGSVWLEAAPATHVVRADVVPHLDAVEVDVLLRHAADLAGSRRTAEDPPPADLPSVQARLRATILAATVNDENLLDPDPRSLVADASDPLAIVDQEIELPGRGSSSGASVALQFGSADTWSPAVPALYVLRLEVLPVEQPLDAREARERDEFWTTFGIRHVTVDPDRPSVLLNGERTFFRGVGLHPEALSFDADGELVGGTPAQRPEQLLADLRDAAAIGADFLRAGHQPADPTMLMLADRLGFAVWEEIPMYHATPLIFGRTMARGIPQQMLREMALRDMNRPSVLFHGFANESTGDEERSDALAQLHEVDRAIDGTRLTGQAAYGWRPTDPTHAPLDVAGFTFYHGVFYGEEASTDTRVALLAARDANPGKPIMILEFGRWADLPIDEERQRAIFEETYPMLERYRGDERGGFVAAATWWTLHDFATQISGIEVEDFGLYRSDGTLRPAGEVAAESFRAPGGRGDALGLEPELSRPRAEPANVIGDWSLALYVGYGLAFAVALLGLALVVLTRRGGRAVGRAR